MSGKTLYDKIGDAHVVDTQDVGTCLLDIDGHLVYHLTTFFEKGGMVTVFAFDKAVALTEGSGWWGNVHWKVITSRDGKPLVLVAQKKQALAVAQSQFGPATDMSPPNSTPTPKETR